MLKIGNYRYRFEIKFYFKVRICLALFEEVKFVELPLFSRCNLALLYRVLKLNNVETYQSYILQI